MECIAGSWLCPILTTIFRGSQAGWYLVLGSSLSHTHSGLSLSVGQSVTSPTEATESVTATQPLPLVFAEDSSSYYIHSDS